MMRKTLWRQSTTRLRALRLLTPADRPDGATGRRNELDRLHASSRELRGRLLRIKTDYEGGRLTLDEELALVRGIERELVAVGLAIHDRAAERP